MRKVVVVPIVVLASIGVLLVLANLLLGDSGHDPASYTRVYLITLTAKIDGFQQDYGRLPVDLNELLAPPTPKDDLGPYAKPREFLDRWHREFYYRQVRGPCGFVLFSLGADGRLGGSGQDRDIAAECHENGS